MAFIKGDFIDSKLGMIVLPHIDGIDVKGLTHDEAITRIEAACERSGLMLPPIHGLENQTKVPIATGR